MPLAPVPRVNRLSQRPPEPVPPSPIDPERRALEMRIERAKSRIVEDLNRAGSLVREVAARTTRGVGRLALLSGVLVAGAIVFALVRLGRRRRIRITWK